MHKPAAKLSNLKRRIKVRAYKLRQAYVKRFKSFSREDFASLLEDIEVRAGDMILVHSSIAGFDGFEGDVQDIVRGLQDAVGETGHILMPNQPFVGTAVAYAEGDPVFDVRRTTSLVGLLPEVFRRMPGVRRSVHPTHSVAVFGPRRDELIHDAHKTETPCGQGSVYEKFSQAGGKILLLGLEMNVFTYYHFLEEELEPLLPLSPFTDKIYDMKSITEDGEIVVTRMRLFDKRLSRARNMVPVIPYLEKHDALRVGMVGTLRGYTITSAGLRDACFEMANDGIYCYDL